ncbi:MAG: MmcQ/YjbR family DNA-binding protein, partial [Lachnospiraceae bacterium]|nr:MmcQ/YjbR family DNA-binding protein [Lachnospiraceae bacterium]
MERKDIFAYVKQQYGTTPEHPWKQYPDYAVLRHSNGKWYAENMNLKRSQIGLYGESKVDVMKVKFNQE